MGNTPPSSSSTKSKSTAVLAERTGTAVLLNIPSRIRKIDVEICIQKRVEDLVPRRDLDNYNPRIFVSYATGNRPGQDDEGCGPGMYYTKALVDIFNNLGYETFTGLHIGPFVNWRDHYISKLNNKVADVLIVVLTPALFRSVPCLDEVYTAKVNGVKILPVSFEHPWIDKDGPWPKATTPLQQEMVEVAMKELNDINSHPKPPSTVLQNPADNLMTIYKEVNLILQKIPYYIPGVMPKIPSSPSSTLFSSSDESDNERPFKPPFKIIAINLRKVPERLKTNRSWIQYLNSEKDELRGNLQKLYKLATSSTVAIDPFGDDSGCQRAVAKLNYRIRIKGQLCEDDYIDINDCLDDIRDILFEGLRKVGLDKNEATSILKKVRLHGAWEGSINICFKAPEQVMSVLYNLIHTSEIGFLVGVARNGQPMYIISLDPVFEILPQNKKTALSFCDSFGPLIREENDDDYIDLMITGENENIGIFLPTSSEAACNFFDKGSIKLSRGLTSIIQRQFYRSEVEVTCAPASEFDAIRSEYHEMTTQRMSSSSEDRKEVVNKSLIDQYGGKGIYTGMVLRSTGMPHGLGQLKYEEDGRVYEGDWRHGRWHGYGRATFSNGDSYAGNYHFGRRHGHGKYRWHDGRVYDGAYWENNMHGHGVFNWPSGAIYDGEFVKDQRQGPGKYTYTVPTVGNTAIQRVLTSLGEYDANRSTVTIFLGGYNPQ